VIEMFVIANFMFTVEDFIISVFCCIDDMLLEIYQIYPPRSKGFAPRLSDSEVMTMEIVAEYLGIDTDKGIWSYFRRHWQPLFPQIPHRTSFVRQGV
jgi:hypothetical protein